MGLRDEMRQLERQTFFNGQRLFANDLQTLESFNRELRWLHNRSLHQPGIGDGFAVSGFKGDRQVRVEPGYAIDVEGREIVLLEGIDLDVPPVAGELDGTPVYYDLVVSYPDDEALAIAETRAGVCAPRGAVRLREQPVFCWVRLVKTEAAGSPSSSGDDMGVRENLVAVDGRMAAEIERGLRLVIARAEILNCELNKDLFIAERRDARVKLGPHIGCGDFAPNPWQVHWWSMEDDIRAALTNLITSAMSAGRTIFMSEPSSAAFSRALLFGQGALASNLFLGALGPIILPIGLEAVVPTHSACFRTTPHYMVRLAGDRMLRELDMASLLRKHDLLDLNEFDSSDRIGLQEALGSLNIEIYWEGLISVLAPQPGQFTARVAVMVQPLAIPDLRALTRVRVLQQHVADRFWNSPIGEKLRSCQGLTGADRERCIDEAVEMIMILIEDAFLSLLEPLQWKLVWMGVEG